MWYRLFFVYATDYDTTHLNKTDTLFVYLDCCYVSLVEALKLTLFKLVTALRGIRVLTVLNLTRKDYKKLWSKTQKSVGGKYGNLSNVPFRPTLSMKRMELDMLESFVKRGRWFTSHHSLLCLQYLPRYLLHSTEMLVWMQVVKLAQASDTHRS